MKQQIKEMVTQLNSFETHNLYQRKITSFGIVLQIGKADGSITLFVKRLTFLHILPQNVFFKFGIGSIGVVQCGVTPALVLK